MKKRATSLFLLLTLCLLACSALAASCIVPSAAADNSKLSFNSSGLGTIETQESITYVGGDACAVITSDGSLYTWGFNNAYGKLGLGHTQKSVSTPTKVNIPAVKLVRQNEHNMAAITETGDLYIWGRAWNYSSGTDNTEQMYSPKKVEGIANAKDVFLGYGDSNSGYAALTSDGKYYRFGSDLSYEFSKPQRITAATDGTDLSATVFTTLCYESAIDSNGKLYVYTPGESGKLDLINIPEKVVTAYCDKGIMGMGSYIGGCAITESGKLYTWGSNKHGELGVGGTMDKTVPQLVESLSNVVAAYVCFNDLVDLQPTEPTCVAITSDGKIYRWGDYYLDENGYSSGWNSPEYIETIDDLAGAKIIECGNRIVAITSDGGVVMDKYGITGDIYTTGYEFEKVSRTSVLSDIKAFDNRVAITNSGDVLTWGNNKSGVYTTHYGILGLGGGSDYIKMDRPPQKVMNLNTNKLYPAHKVTMTDGRLNKYAYDGEPDFIREAYFTEGTKVYIATNDVELEYSASDKELDKWSFEPDGAATPVLAFDGKWYVFEMPNTDVTITPTFKEKTEYQVFITGGYLDNDPNKTSGKYAVGTEVTVLRDVSDYKVLTSWTISLALDQSDRLRKASSHTYTLTMPKEDVFITFNYVDGYPLEVTNARMDINEYHPFICVYDEDNKTKASFEAGKTIGILLSPPEGMKLKRLIKTPANVELTYDPPYYYTLTMPESAVTLEAEYEIAPKRNVTLINCHLASGTNLLCMEDSIVNIKLDEPATGKEFSHWVTIPAIDIQPDMPGIPETGYRFIVPSQDVTIEAVFADKQYPVNVTNGYLDSTAGKTSGKYAKGTTVTVAYDNSNNTEEFTGWTKTPASLVMTKGNGNTFTFVMPEETVSLTATYKPKEIKVATEVKDGKGGTASASISKGSPVLFALIAEPTPNTGWKFKEWTKNGAFVSKSNPYITYLTLDTTGTYVAVFEKDADSVEVGVNNSAMGSAANSGSGTSAVLTAAANDGYRFVDWAINNESVSFDNPYTLNITDKGKVVVTARFEPKPEETPVVKQSSLTLKPISDKLGSAKKEDVAANVAKLTATQEDTYYFIGWSANGAIFSTANPCTFKYEGMGDVEVSAIFIKANFTAAGDGQGAAKETNLTGNVNEEQAKKESAEIVKSAFFSDESALSPVAKEIMDINNDGVVDTEDEMEIKK